MSQKELARRLGISDGYLTRLLKGQRLRVGRHKLEAVQGLLRGLGGQHDKLLAWTLVTPETVSDAHRRQKQLARELHRYGFFLHPDDQPILFASALGDTPSVRLIRDDTRVDTPAALYERLLAIPRFRIQIEGFERWVTEQRGENAEAQLRARLAVCQALDPLATAARIEGINRIEGIRRPADRADEFLGPSLEGALSAQRALIEGERAARRTLPTAADGRLSLVVNQAGRVTAFVSFPPEDSERSENGGRCP